MLGGKGMNGAFYIGAAGMDAQQRALDIVANNIANINTTGFKRSAVRFSELVAAIDSAADPASISNILTNSSGVAVGAVPHVWAQGDVKQTGQELDLAIDGVGFLELLGPSGRSLLWRGGTLKVNADGYLASTDGIALRATISVPEGTSKLVIARDGVVSALVGGETDMRQMGQIDLVMVNDADTLKDAGNGYYEATDPAGIVTVQAGDNGSGAFVQGALESSNVQLTEEMVSLLLMQRSYAASAQVVQAGDQLMGIVNGLRR
jgi:flagellar basal-body rod protein FlgG